MKKHLVKKPKKGSKKHHIKTAPKKEHVKVAPPSTKSRIEKVEAPKVTPKSSIAESGSGSGSGSGSSEASGSGGESGAGESGESESDDDSETPKDEMKTKASLVGDMIGGVKLVNTPGNGSFLV